MKPTPWKTEETELEDISAHFRSRSPAVESLHALLDQQIAENKQLQLKLDHYKSSKQAIDSYVSIASQEKGRKQYQSSKSLRQCESCKQPSSQKKKTRQPSRARRQDRVETEQSQPKRGGKAKPKEQRPSCLCQSQADWKSLLSLRSAMLVIESFSKKYKLGLDSKDREALLFDITKIYREKDKSVGRSRPKRLR